MGGVSKGRSEEGKKNCNRWSGSWLEQRARLRRLGVECGRASSTASGWETASGRAMETKGCASAQSGGRGGPKAPSHSADVAPTPPQKFARRRRTAASILPPPPSTILHPSILQNNRTARPVCARPKLRKPLSDRGERRFALDLRAMSRRPSSPVSGEGARAGRRRGAHGAQCPHRDHEDLALRLTNKCGVLVVSETREKREGLVWCPARHPSPLSPCPALCSRPPPVDTGAMSTTCSRDQHAFKRHRGLT